MIDQKRDDLKMPEGLDADGTAAYEAIMQFLRERELTYTGGCRAFYSPDEWKERGERYGLQSVLVICHDGGDLAPALNLDYEMYDLHDALQAHLGRAGFYVEGCTGWYSAVYRS